MSTVIFCWVALLRDQVPGTPCCQVALMVAVPLALLVYVRVSVPTDAVVTLLSAQVGQKPRCCSNGIDTAAPGAVVTPSNQRATPLLSNK